MKPQAVAAAALPWSLVGLVRLLDRADPATMGTLRLGLHDEPAHLSTSVLVLLALVGPRRMLEQPVATATSCASSMLIDIDHVPLYITIPGLPDVAVDNGRPFTHSLSTIAALGALAGAWRYRRAPLAAAAGGVGLHFVRDIATGHGLPVWWPFEHKNRKLPYAWYARLLLGLAAVGSVRSWRWAEAR
jgi:inner membrane protein